MSHDISKSVSQGSIGAQDAENCRIEAIANELRRRCELYEAQRGDSQSHVSLFEIEQRATEVYAKENGLWLTMEEVFDLGVPGPSGNENDTYFSDDIVYKVNNLLNCGSILRLLDKVKMHNERISRTDPVIQEMNATGVVYTPGVCRGLTALTHTFGCII